LPVIPDAAFLQINGFVRKVSDPDSMNMGWREPRTVRVHGSRIARLATQEQEVFGLTERPG